MPSRIARSLVFAVAVACVAASPAAAAAPPTPVTLRVMTFNIWYGGDQVDFGQVAAAIRAARADVVGIQEADGNLRRVADAVGFPYVDERRYLISRYPLFDSGRGAGTRGARVPLSINGQDPHHTYAWVLVGPGRAVAMANTHLTSDPYGPEAARDGKTARQVLALERSVRLQEVRPLAANLGRLARAGIPVFLTGDFNSPSYLDWTPAAVAARGLPFPLVWPASLAVARAGLRDSFRAVHPDPVADPGLTWTPGRPTPYIPDRETLDRIDLVWSGGRATPVSSEVVGEAGNPAVRVPVWPWPSDHRAVVSEFRVQPATPPALVHVDPRIVSGQDILVRFVIPGRRAWEVAIVRRGGRVRDAVAAAGTNAGGDGYADRPSVRLGSADIRPGAYDALLLDRRGRQLAHQRFTIVARGARPRVSVVSRTVRPGAPIRVRWRNAPGWRNDWLGVFSAGDHDAFDYLGYVYTGAAVSGHARLTRADVGRLPPGRYVVRLLRDDSYVALAGARFRVR